MWIISKLYGASNTDYLARIEVDKSACQLYGILPDGRRIPICDDEREMLDVMEALKRGARYVGVS